jgi:hypothetical protein
MQKTYTQVLKESLDKMDVTKILIIIYCFIIAGSVFGGFFYILKKKNAYLDIEKKHIPVYSNKFCGGRLGHFGTMVVTIPFVRITIYDEFVVISSYKKILLYLNEIERIEPAGLFLHCLLIRHKNPKYPNPFTICAREAEKIKEIIEKLRDGH